MKPKLFPAWDVVPRALAGVRRAGVLLVLGHAVAIACALWGLYLIVADSLDSVVYGVALFGLGVALDVIVASRCNADTTRRRQTRPPRIVNIRTKKARRSPR